MQQLKKCHQNWPLLVFVGSLSSTSPLQGESPAAPGLLYQSTIAYLLNSSRSLSIDHWPESGFKPTLGRTVWLEECGALMSQVRLSRPPGANESG